MRRLASVMLVGALVLGCGSPAPPAPTPPTPPTPPAPTTPTGPSVGDPPPSTQTRAVPVYYVSETAAGLRLQREFHRVETADPAGDAVREMLADATGFDPDYRTLWPTGTSLRRPVSAADGVITVDLTGLTPGAQVGSAGAVLSVQQLVYTVQGALQSTDPVRILLDGEPVDELFGAVSTADPVPRADILATRSLVQIDAPAEGARLASPVRVTGEAAVFEATLLWEILRDGQVVRSGVTSTTRGQAFAPFAFTVQLEPGEYVVRITEDDPSGGEGRPALADDKTITVTR